MSQTIDLKALEKKAWKSVFQDGLWDIYLGILLMAFAVGAWLDRQPISENMRVGIYIGVQILAMIVLFAGKRFVTMPRMGTVKFGVERKKRRHIVQLVLFISALVGLGVWFLSATLSGEGRGAMPGRWVFPLIWVLNMLMVFGLGAYFLEYERLYVIGFLYAIVIPLDVIVKTTAKVDLDMYIFLAAGSIILFMGIACLVRFVRGHKPLNLNQG